MKNIFTFFKKTVHVSPFLVVSGICFILAIIFYPHAVSQVVKKTSATRIKGVSTTVTATVTPLPSSEEDNTGVNSIFLTVTPTEVPTQATQTQTVQSQPPSTPIPTAQPTSAPAQTVNMQISEPDGTSNFSLPVEGNVCDELSEAKNEGKIRSVTFSDTYMNSMHSMYVTEMNGYQNNWTFTVNGSGPQGCSLYSPKPGDSIVWKFN